MANSPFTDVPAAIEEIRAGRMVVVVDDEDRENEGDLTLAAEKVTPEAINFMPQLDPPGLSSFRLDPDGRVQIPCADLAMVPMLEPCSFVHRRERDRGNRLKSFNKATTKAALRLTPPITKSNLECLVKAWRELYIAPLCPTITSPATCHY